MSTGSKPVKYLTNRTVVVSLVLKGSCTKPTRAAEFVLFRCWICEKTINIQDCTSAGFHIS